MKKFKIRKYLNFLSELEAALDEALDRFAELGEDRLDELRQMRVEVRGARLTTLAYVGSQLLEVNVDEVQLDELIERVECGLVAHYKEAWTAVAATA